MNFAAVSFRSAVAAVAVVSASAAHAVLPIPFGWTTSNSVQTFTSDNLDAFDLAWVTVTAKGTATPVGAPIQAWNVSNYQAFNMPITKIVISSGLTLESGSANGAALYFFREDVDTGLTYNFTLANFTINYATGLVLADVTTKAGTVIKQQELYTFHTASPLAFKYQFPLLVTGHQVLDQLLLTESSKNLFINELVLPSLFWTNLDVSFGSLTQDISTKLRNPPLTNAPYVVQ
jgi:hypothetical protein